ncbi:TetR family transcriptional regulator [Micromonospora sp. WMMA1363]|uniref:TetR family transcriptional regulator n=1 Tax=Micromonospora sp. WMMA1363 TaxID=3053985 RepID=UPI00259CB023|nr:TetR family transcriptional regulator [Micromonospora sp. WMMA1363]MDM4718950.1 TetR family transcriptional regulator [Micromonospora sp. WMMA1363]
MTAEAPDDTRTQILRVALDLFARYGYQRTSLRQIAERLRLTKAGVLYHFPAKEDLLSALTEPLLVDLESLLDATAALPPPRAREALLAGWIDTLLRHRRPLRVLFHDIAMLSRGVTYHRIMQIARRANEIVAGPDARRRERVRAVQAIAMCSDPIVLIDDVPEETLRADMLDGVHRLLGGAGGAGDAGPPAGAEPLDGASAGTRRTAGRRQPGRPRSMGPEQVRTARRLHAAGTHSVDEIATVLGVSRATVYRHLDRSDAD